MVLHKLHCAWCPGADLFLNAEESLSPLGGGCNHFKYIGVVAVVLFEVLMAICADNTTA